MTNKIAEIGEVFLRRVLSVEKGNVDNEFADRKVVAFTISGTKGEKIKVLLKNKKAELVWGMFLKDGKTKSSTIDKDGVKLDKDVFVSFESAEIREVRTNKEVVCQNPINLTFTFNYVVS